MLAHNTEDNRQPQAGADAPWLGGEEWIENARLDGLRNSRAVVTDFQEHAPFGDALGLHADGAALALLLNGMPSVANEVHEHLLKLAGITLHERQDGVEIELQTDLIGRAAEALQFESAGDDLIERDAAEVGPRIPGGKKQLAQDGAGPLRFLKDLARFMGVAEGIAPQEQPLRVAENAGEGVTKFVSDPGDHLAEFGKLLRLQQLG